ncbi:MAG: helix-turn-helix domain-containing protein [Archangium sp.]|nr:helix-turn-helix domain-containing protein [Archangium sp.]
MHLGATLRLLRVGSGFGLRELAQRLGVSSAYLSRVENGIDPVPTEERLADIARELDVPVALLLDTAHRVSPFVLRYAEQRPQAASLFLELARRDLDEPQLAEVRQFIARRFPRRGRIARHELALAPLLGPRAVVLELECDDLEEAVEIGCARFDPGTLERRALPALFTSLDSAPVGAQVAVPFALAPAVEAQAVLVTLARPLRLPTMDELPVTTVVLLLAPSRSTAHLARIAHVARLAARGLAGELRGLHETEQARERLAALEADERA